MASYIKLPTIVEIAAKATNIDLTISYLVSLGLLLPSMICPGSTKYESPCGKQMRLQEVQKLGDGKRWHCSCGITRSVRTLSIFHNSNLSLGHNLMVLYFYAIDLQIFQVARMLKIDRHAIGHMYGKLRKQVVRTIPQMMNPGLFANCDAEYDEGILECDESKFGKLRKHGKGKPHRRYWVFGIAQRNTRKTFFKVVRTRDADTLIPLIAQCATPGSTIYSDEWKAYNSLSNNYTHKTVCHKYTFKSPEGVCTNLIEGINSAPRIIAPKSNVCPRMVKKDLIF